MNKIKRQSKVAVHLGHDDEKGTSLEEISEAHQVYILSKACFSYSQLFFKLLSRDLYKTDPPNYLFWCCFSSH